ncbi:MAG TPA: IS66 family transposase [Terracidiphilus sp.]|nr:IS66 family transposase [Terracidiphilus sp.]
MFRGQLTSEQALRFALLGPEAIRLGLLAANARFKQLQQSTTLAPSTPSGMVPVYQKPSVDRRRRKKPGAKPGHTGSRRQIPRKIDARVEHRLDACPCCGGELQRCKRSRTRIIEDIPQEITPVVTEHTIHRDYCPSCKKHVEPVVPDAMPNATLGHRVVALSSWFHYGLGVTIGQVRDILGSHLHTDITAGGLLDGWQRLAETLFPWYEQIGREARAGAVLHADETGWRVDGETYWLWCFCNHRCCYYLIDPSRGLPALQRFFIEAFKGTLVTDFWGPYDSVCAGDNQRCLPHLLRELFKVDELNGSAEWKAFGKQLKRLVRDGIRMRKREDFTPERYASRIHLIHRRLCRLADAEYADADTVRLGNRISKYRDQLFTFLDTPGVPPDNNLGERQIRPAVIIRKNSLCNRSEQGAATQAILMSIYRTLKLRGPDPTKAIADALRTLLQTGTLPPLPVENVADG